MPNLSDDDLADAVRHSERQLEGRDATDRYLEHAEHVRSFDQALVARGAPVKAAYRSAGLNYLLARKALWLGEFLNEHEDEHPGLITRGPSILLFGREAERRLAREGRASETGDLLKALEAGTPRDAVRKKYFATSATPIASLFAALRSGRVEPARRAFAELNDVDRGEVIRFSNALGRLVTGCASPVTEMDGGEDVPSTIEDALLLATRDGEDDE